MGIGAEPPDGVQEHLGLPRGQGYGKPETRRLPYDDYGLVTIAAITGSGVAQAVATASYDGSTSGLVPGDFVFLEFGLANEEHANVISVDTVNQTFTAIVTIDHPRIEHPALDLADRRVARRERPGVSISRLSLRLMLVRISPSSFRHKSRTRCPLTLTGCLRAGFGEFLYGLARTSEAKLLNSPNAADTRSRLATLATESRNARYGFKFSRKLICQHWFCGSNDLFKARSNLARTV